MVTNNVSRKIRARNTLNGIIYATSYDGCICLGELFRNICVNLGIDPDTVEGVTRNVAIYIVNEAGGKILVDKYDPSISIEDVHYWEYAIGSNDQVLFLDIEYSDIKQFTTS